VGNGPAVIFPRAMRGKKFWFRNILNLRVLRELRGERKEGIEPGYPHKSLKSLYSKIMLVNVTAEPVSGVKAWP